MKVLLIFVVIIATAFCGVLQGRIIGGSVAEDGKYPFSAAIRKITSTGKYFCGGALISDQWILTAAYCVEDGVEFIVQLGSNSLSSTDENRQTVTSNTSIIHPNYSNITLENDIGLIQLPSSIPLSDRISPIALPIKDLESPTVGEIIGWGQTDDMISGPVDLLNFVQVITLQNTVCQRSYGSFVKNEMICAIGNYIEGICIGDIGSPLVTYNENNEAVHSGIGIFFSDNGCESPDPSGFARTALYLDWIKSVTGI